MSNPSPPQPHASLSATDLTCERNGRVLFSKLNFTVKSGEFVEVRGPNGAGKSSLLRLIAGLLAPAAGNLQWHGHPHENDIDNDLAQACHFIAHQDAVKPALTVAENLQFWCALLGGTTIEAALNAFGLEALRHEPVQILSAGQRRRLALSRVLLVKRPLWLLDEPTTALDGPSEVELIQHLKDHLADGGMAILANHGSPPIKPDVTLQLLGPPP